jgi:hypothetical protein
VNRLLTLGGLAAGVVLIAFGIGSIVIASNGKSDVREQLQRENITGSDDMTPDRIKAAAAEAGLRNVPLPTCRVAGQKVRDGESAKCFAEYMRVHALEATQGRTYSQMGQFLTEDGKETSDAAEAAKDPETGKPVPNAARNVWVTETALSTALNTSFFAESVANFSIVVGIALLLTGIGFLVLSLAVLRRRDNGSAHAA